jgi:hypothetical protein
MRMENKMDCKDYEEKILEGLDKKELPPKILSHINKCKNCFKFYKYIVTLKEGLNGIEILEPSPDFDIRLIEKLKKEPHYLKTLAFVNSFAVFVSFLFVSLIVKRYFAQIAVFFGKILKVFDVLSGTFWDSFYTIATLLFLGVIFFVIASGVFDFVLLSKLIKNGGRS